MVYLAQSPGYDPHRRREKPWARPIGHLSKRNWRLFFTPGESIRLPGRQLDAGSHHPYFRQVQPGSTQVQYRVQSAGILSLSPRGVCLTPGIWFSIDHRDRRWMFILRTRPSWPPQLTVDRCACVHGMKRPAENSC